MSFEAKKVRIAEIYNENFNHFFTEKLNSITIEQKQKIPNDLAFKIYSRGNEASARKLNFNEKMWLLEVVFGLNVTITVEDPINGLETKDYNAARKAQRGSLTNGELLDVLKIKSVFVIGGKQLMESILYMSHVTTTGIYQLVKKYIPNAGHEKNMKFEDQRKAFANTLRFLKHYEANKRRIASDYGLSMPEWYALIYFAIGESFAVDFYKKDFLYSYNSSSINLHKAITRLYNNGYLLRKQIAKKHKYTVSSKGIDTLNRIFDNILLKF